ncbi:MAG: membrane lipoprotein lipid attachment site-containing protein [Thiomargarita sp.]|nr:membrane lipoprotein lipid attachment site-containing protein [Thiomargarita sp.]
MKKILVTIISILLLAGCSGYKSLPTAVSYPDTSQRKMQAAHHWDVLAKDLAQRIKKTLYISFPDMTVKPPLFLKRVYVKNPSPFDQTFFNLLNSRLIQNGLVVINNNLGYDNYLLIEYNMQVIHRESNAEIIITTAITMGQQYLFGDSRIYYINNGDSDHYENNTKTYQLVNN